MFPRSSNKPMQALGMLRSGLDLDGELLALAGASHSGEQFHLDGVRRILAGAVWTSRRCGRPRRTRSTTRPGTSGYAPVTARSRSR